MKELVLIVFGGPSVEHDISIITALQTMRFLPDDFKFLPVYIDRMGCWWTADNLDDIAIYKNFSSKAKNKKRVNLVCGERKLFFEKRGKFVEGKKIYAVLNCCHGNIGEDGSIQGFLKICKIPHTSCGVVSSALCMDKCFMKDVLKSNAIPSAEYFYFNKQDYEKQHGRLPNQLKFPLIVKPANLGSSIGISVCKSESEYNEAVELALEFDQKILVEKVVENLREFNCACFFFKGQWFVSEVNEVKNKSEIYTFDDKYLANQATSVKASKNLSKRIKNLTEKVYRVFDCTGVVRVDFLLDNKSNMLYVNEINTIPGSLALYLFKDVSFKEIISALIDQAVEDETEMSKKIITFESKAIEIYEKSKPVSKK